MTNDYRPISCALYSGYELAILHREWLRVCWGRGGQLRLETLRPIDLRTRRGQEFMIARNLNEVCLVLRLDRIRRALSMAADGALTVGS